MKTGQKTILGRITLNVVIVLLVCIIVTVTACNYIVVKSSKSDANKTLTMISNYYAQQIDSWIVEEKQLTEDLGKAVLFSNIDDTDVLKNLVNLYSSGRDEVLDMYVGNAKNKAFVKYAPSAIPEGYDCTSRGWWKAAVEAKKTTVTAPYVDAFTGLMCITVASPIYENGELVGVVGLDVSLDTVNEIVESMFTDEYSGFLVDNDGQIVIHEHEAYLPTEDSTIPYADIVPNVANKVTDADGLMLDYDYNGVKQIYAVADVSGCDWKIVASKPYSSCYSVLSYSVIIALIVGIISLIVAFFIIKRVCNIALAPVNRMKNFVIEKIIGAENYKADKTEIQDIDKLVNSMEVEFLGTIRATRTEVENIDSEVKGAGAKMEDMNSSISTISASIEETSASIEVQTENIAEISASCEEVANAINDINGETISMQSRVNEIRKKVNAMTEDVENKIVKAKDLSASSTERLKVAVEGISVVEEIGQIADTIRGVAESTNLLALNASIEAARAGEAGKGFAVVAEEIGKLSSETTTQVDEVYNMVSKAVKNAEVLKMECENILTYLNEDVLNDYDEFAKTMEQYKTDCEYYSDTSNTLANGLSQISSGVQNVNTTLADISDSQNQLNRTVEEIGDSLNDMIITSHDTAGAFAKVGGASDTLKDTVQKFNI